MNYKYIEKKRSWLLRLPISFTTYSIGEDEINIKSGFLNVIEDNTQIYKIQDVRLILSITDRIFKTGTIICYTGDITDPVLKLTGLKNAENIKEYIIEASEEARKQRREEVTKSFVSK